MQAATNRTGHARAIQLKEISVASGHCGDGTTEHEVTALASVVVRGKRIAHEVIVTVNVDEMTGEVTAAPTLLPEEFEAHQALLVMRAVAAVCEAA